jgi:hypothetical protein
MRCRTHTVRARLDRLEARDVPTTNLTVTFSAVTHTLTIIGDANADDVAVVGVAASPTQYIIDASGTINGLPQAFTSPTGVKNLAFKMLGGNASVTFDPSVPITVQGNVTFTGGTGANTVTATHLTVGKNLSVTNAAQFAGTDIVQLIDFSAGGSVTVKNAGGNSSTQISRDTVGVSTIKGNLTVTNGTGQDTFQLNDTNVNGSVTVNNGHGNLGVGGQFVMYNLDNTAFRSVIGGNLTVSYLDGNASSTDYLMDTEVLGNVALNHGSGDFLTDMNGYNTRLPVVIHGSLTMTGTGANSVGFGTVGFGTGVVVDKGFTYTSGGGTAETLAFSNFRVGGDTSIKLGNAGNTVTIDDSEFDGRFTLVSGSGNDTFNLEATAGTSSATEFHKAVLVDLGTGNDFARLTYTGTEDNWQEVVAWGTFEVKVPSVVIDANRILFPNGGTINFM